MKSYLKSWIFLFLAAFVAPVILSANYQDDYNGLPGDDFSLEGALDLFKRSNSLEEFERELNSSDNSVNNLDLNNNGRIDYLRVVDHAEDGDLHAIVIQALIEQGISQDVAVIEVKRNRYGEAVVQIVGDEDLYGTAKIVEPYPYDDMVGTDYYDNYYDHYSPTVFVNAWAWPSVRFIFAPRYVVWVSPYYYDYYPGWYHSWGPHPYHVWHTRTIVYHHHYCVAPNYRIPEVHHYYGTRRVSAPVVHQRTEKYVAAHGGRSNFNHGKRNDTVEAPRSGNLDRSEKPAVTTRTDRQREQSPVAKPSTNNPRQEVAPTRPKAAATPDTKKREQSPVAKPSTNNPRQDVAPTRPKAENSTRQTASPTREAPLPRANNSVNNQNRNNISSPPAPARVDRKPAAAAAPKTNRTETNSRPSKPSGSNGSVGKSSLKSDSSQPRKGKG